LDQATILGLTAPFSFAGKTYQVEERGFEHEGMFSRWLANESREWIQRLKVDMSLDEYQSQLKGWRDDCATHQFDWGMPLTVAAMISPAGSKQLALLALGKYNQGVDLKLIDAIYKDDKAWSELTAVMGALNDPNRQRSDKDNPAPR
jgi:hypothetical protein